MGVTCPRGGCAQRVGMGWGEPGCVWGQGDVRRRYRDPKTGLERGRERQRHCRLLRALGVRAGV